MATKQLRVRETWRRAGDSKVSPLMRCKTEPTARKTGQGWRFDVDVKAKNSIGTLPAHRHNDGTIEANGCDSATAFCFGGDGPRCYADTLATVRTAVANSLAHNLAVEQNLTADEITAAYVEAFRAYIVECRKYDVPADDWVWRERWSGDVSPTTAAAFADALTLFPEIHAWIYTRNPMSALILAPVANLTVYASVDAWNVDTWRPILESDSRILAAACAETIDQADLLLEKLGRRTIVRAIACPENIGRLPIAVPLKGEPIRSKPAKGQMLRGACVACQHCVVGRGDVKFATRGR